MDLLGLGDSVYIHWVRTVLRLVGVIFVFIIIFTNIEYIFTYKSTREKVETILKEGEDTSSCTSQSNSTSTSANTNNDKEKIIGKVKINSSIVFDKKKKKNVKTIQISLMNDDNSLKYSNLIYIVIDVGVNHLLISLIFYIIKENDKIGFIIMFYIILVFLLFVRVSIIRLLVYSIDLFNLGSLYHR